MKITTCLMIMTIMLSCVKTIEYTNDKDIIETIDTVMIKVYDKEYKRPTINTEVSHDKH